MSVENWNEPIEATEGYSGRTDPEVVRIYPDSNALVVYKVKGVRCAAVFAQKSTAWRNVPKPEPKRETVEEVRAAVGGEWNRYLLADIERMARAVFHEEMERRVRK